MIIDSDGTGRSSLNNTQIKLGRNFAGKKALPPSLCHYFICPEFILCHVFLASVDTFIHFAMLFVLSLWVYIYSYTFLALR